MCRTFPLLCRISASEYRISPLDTSFYQLHRGFHPVDLVFFSTGNRISPVDIGYGPLFIDFLPRI